MFFSFLKMGLLHNCCFAGDRKKRKAPVLGIKQATALLKELLIIMLAIYYNQRGEASIIF